MAIPEDTRVRMLEFFDPECQSDLVFLPNAISTLTVQDTV